jgi:CO/xanthine dehydrogenase Mo-binding subunit
MRRRTLLKAGGMLVVGVAFGEWPLPALAQPIPNADRFLGKPIDPKQVDSFLAIHADNTVTVFTGKVDLGTGARIAFRQMVAEELDVPPSRLVLIEGDTAVTPDQARTSGSYGIARGGMQLRHAAATARRALLEMASPRLGRPVDDLEVADGVVRVKGGGASVRYGELVGDKPLGLAVDPKAPLKDPQRFRYIGHSLPRPDVPAKVTGRHRYVADLKLPNMLHARVLHPPAVGATLSSVDESSIARIPGVRVARIESLLAVVGEREWDVIRAARVLKAEWTGGTPLPEHAKLFESMKAATVVREQSVAKKGDVAALTSPPAGAKLLTATYGWPVQSHASLGPSCGVADVKADRATIWSSTQGPHQYRNVFARILGMPKEHVRVIFVEGAGTYGQAGAEDAACEAMLLSRALGRPVRVQWMRHDEHGWDPKGPPQLLQLRAALEPSGTVAAWETLAWLPAATANLPNVPLLGPDLAKVPQPQGRQTGLIHQNIDPPYAFANMHATVHWIADAPLRTSAIRAPGKIANTFAVESFTDEVAAAAGVDALDFRLRHLTNPRGREVLQAVGVRMNWQARPSPQRLDPNATVLKGRGLAYVHYKHEETIAAIGMEVEVERATGRIRVTRVVAAQDCGLMINPDSVKSQVEGNILQTLSRTLHEDTVFDRQRVTSVDWATYPILTFPEVPALDIELIQRLNEPPLGAGEAASTPVPAALSNAVFDATGVRLREVPFRPARVKAALAARPS